jgi:hypothetical protein
MHVEVVVKAAVLMDAIVDVILVQQENHKVEWWLSQDMN